jgi:hypothetical protein
MVSRPLKPSTVHGAIFVTKAIRSLTSWLSAFLAAKLLQDNYTQEVYVERIAPSPLTTFVWYYAAFQLAFAILILTVMAGVVYVYAGTTSELAVLVRFAAVDIAIELVVTAIILLFVANVMQNKKYFNYRYEGLRAIRALRTMAFRVSLVTNAIPYQMLFGDVAIALNAA